MKFTKTILSVAALSLFLAATSYALPSAGDNVTFAGGDYRATSGGDFNATVTDGNGKTTNYITFCLERNEYLNFNDTYTVSSITDYAENGGITDTDNNTTDNKDHISDATRWVYWNYLYGSFDHDNSNLAGSTLSKAVQKSIWQLEGEYNSSDDLFANDTTSLTFYNNVVMRNGQSYDIAGNVQVMNIIKSDGTHSQSQLIADPVPEPTTMLLFGTGIAGLAAVGRRRMNK